VPGGRQISVAAQRGERHDLAVGELVAGRDRRDDRLLLDDVDLHPGRGVLADADDRGVEPPLAQVVEQPVGVRRGERDLDAGMVAVEAGEQGGQVDPVRGDRADRDPPAQQPGELLDREPRPRHRGERRPRIRQHGLAGLGEPYRAAGPVEQLRAELPLQPADLRAHPGLGDAHPLGGPGEAPLLGHRDEVLELPQLHNRRF
jgi:hypothetical protein